MGIAAATIGGTIAYFSDTETSIGNTFEAGKFNLKVDNSCQYNGNECVCGDGCYWEGTEDPCFCAWEEKDMEGELFFSLDDVKPGDHGESTISLHVDDNDAWLCAQIANLKNYDNGCENPEATVDQTCGDPGETEGELQNYLRFTVWRDNGEGEFSCNNILNEGEQILVENQLSQEIVWPIADSSNGTPLIGDETHCIGVSWNLPLATNNIVQTDSMVGDVRFTAVQARHMEEFSCTEMFTEVCDGIDNDYDGEVDEDWPNLGQTCTAGLGTCQQSGTYVCDINNPAGPEVCSAVAGTPGEEICMNGVDNDCDGLIDCADPDCNGQTCDDGVYCNGTDTCIAGGCFRHSGNPCSGADGDNNCQESCNEALENCTANDPNNSPCNDGLYCNGTDRCQSGVCQVHLGDPCPGPDGDGDCKESCNEASDNCTANDPSGSACYLSSLGMSGHCGYWNSNYVCLANSPF